MPPIAYANPLVRRTFRPHARKRAMAQRCHFCLDWTLLKRTNTAGRFTIPIPVCERCAARWERRGEE